MVKQKKTSINLRTNEWKGALSRPTRGYLIGAHYDTFSGGDYCAEKGERVLPRGIFGVPSFIRGRSGSLLYSGIITMDRGRQGLSKRPNPV
jgi:hypothetical protein